MKLRSKNSLLHSFYTHIYLDCAYSYGPQFCNSSTTGEIAMHHHADQVQCRKGDLWSDFRSILVMEIAKASVKAITGVI